jgi:DHA2 family multidrug resistance protein
VIGGWITSQWSWHWLFYLNLVPGLWSRSWCRSSCKIDQPDLALLKKGDYLGIALMSAFLGCLEYTLEEGPRKNWLQRRRDRSARTWITAICGFLFSCTRSPRRSRCRSARAEGRNFAIGCLLLVRDGIGMFSRCF